MQNDVTTSREIFAMLLSRREELKKMRSGFAKPLGHPLWWLVFRNGSKSHLQKNLLRTSSAVWEDQRIRRFRLTRSFEQAMRRVERDHKPRLFSDAGRNLHFCAPLAAAGRVFGFLGLSGLRKDAPSECYGFLSAEVRLLTENCCKAAELERLTATIRPRAIALSTVHTVHRIINSTLNLGELVSRLAHLTAQVLRVHRCAIFLIERSSKRKAPGVLVCRALVGHPRHRKHRGKVVWGRGIEGWVAKTARIVSRKQMICVPLIDEDVIGVMTVSRKKDKMGFSYFDREILTTLAEEAVIAIKNAQLYEEQKRVTLGTIQSLAVILGARIPSPVSPEIFLRIVLRVAKELRLSEEETQALHYATLLKDTAKVGIPDEILRKPTKLTGEEYQLLRDHPIKGAKIVQSFESLKPVAPIILYSREKYDGTGYPEGLKADRIPIGARILAVLNAFEAIVVGRPYRGQSSLAEALDELLRNSGTQFDPRVVETFTRVIVKEGFGKLLKNVI